MIEGTVFRRLKKIVDERGFLMEVMREDWPEFPGFKMAYISISSPGVIRAWHRHPRTKQRDTFIVLTGMAKVCVYDPDTMEVDEHFIGEDNPMMLTIDGSKWHGFKAIGDKPCVLLNFPDKLYDYKNPDEERLDYWRGPYDWEMKMP